MENMKKVLERAYQERYAVPQFNIHNLEWTRFILEQANEDQSPVILGVSEKTVPYMGGYIAIASMVNGLVQSLNIKVPVVLKL